MNLYGDLPPAADGSTVTVQSTGTWSGLTVAAKPKPNLSAPSVKPSGDPKPPVIRPSDVKPLVVSSPKLEEERSTVVPKFVPTKVSAALAFKPRQTLQPNTFTRPSPANPSTVQPVQQLLSQSQPQQHSTTSVTRVSKFSPPIQPETHWEQFKHEDAENESFVNEIAAFDVDDPYDPSKPNDYVKLLEEREEAIQLQRLQRENQLVLEENERIREENAKQRLLAVQSGDYSSLLASSINNRGSGISSADQPSSGSENRGSSYDPPMGRGRGRGMINLPAWMTQKMEAEASAASTAAAVSTTSSSSAAALGQFDDAGKVFHCYLCGSSIYIVLQRKQRLIHPLLLQPLLKWLV